MSGWPVRRVGWLVVLALVVAACGSSPAEGPPDIQYGRDICVQCNMIISEIGHAAAYRLDDGTEKKFDGVGEMVLHGREQNELGRADAWVHDYWTEEWVDAGDAFYVPTMAVASPMGHGIFAFADAGRAADFADEVGGEVIDWDTVLRLPITDGRVGDHGDHGDGGTDDEAHDMEGMEESP